MRKREQWRDPDDTNKVQGKCYDEQGKEIAFTPFEIMPRAPYSMQKYLRKKMKYPAVARRNGIEGRVLVRFTVKADGNIGNVTLLNHVSPELDEEAVKVVSEMKPWHPGVQDDRNVDVYFTLPITFRLK